MPKEQVSKAKPVVVSTPIIDCATYVTINTLKKNAENELASLKPRILALVPEGQTAETFEAERNGVRGYYTVTKVTQDRRNIDNEKLAVKLQDKGLYVRACKTTVDHEKVAQLIKDGLFEADDLKDCLTGKEVTYALCDFVALKS